MNALDPAGEFLRIAAHYRQMSDAELLVIGSQKSELTDMAQQALTSELQGRGLKLQSERAQPTTTPQIKPRPVFAEQESARLLESADPDFSDSDSIYAEDRKLVELCQVWSLRDALQVQSILDRAGIPFFMGPEKAMGVDMVTSNYANGVSVMIMQIGWPWAARAMKNYFPADDPTPVEEDDSEVPPVRCPKCQSEEVIFEGVAPETSVSTPAASTVDSPKNFRWTCDSCGNQWQDDGTVK